MRASLTGMVEDKTGKDSSRHVHGPHVPVSHIAFHPLMPQPGIRNVANEASH